MPYTSVNGNMFSFLAKDGSMGIRMPETERENFLRKYKNGLFEAHGTVLKEYVTVPETLVNDLKKLRKFFEISLNYALSLKPKHVKKKRYLRSDCRIYVRLKYKNDYSARVKQLVNKN